MMQGERASTPSAGPRRGLWGSIFGRAAAPARVEPSAPAPTNGSAPPMTTLPPWGNQWPLYGGRYLAENLTTVCGCVQAIAGAIASLPATVMRRVDGKLVEAPDHPVARIIRQPNDLQSWPDFVEWLIASTLLQGNAIAVVDHDQRGAPCALYPVPFWACQPILVPAHGAEAIGSPVVPNSRLVFDITQTMMPYPMPVKPVGFPVRYFSDEILFLRDRSDDGIMGRSRLSRAPGAIACGIGAQGFSEGVWANGAIIGGVLCHPGVLSAEASSRIAETFRGTHSGGANAGRLLVAEEGMSYSQIGISPADSQLLDSRKFTVQELCRLFNCPPAVIGDYGDSNFATSDAAMRFFATGCLAQWITKLEREFSRTVFNSEDCCLSIDMGGLTRGDYAAVIQANVQAVRAGIMSADEARAEIGLNPRGGKADELQPQAIGGRPDGTGDGQGDSQPAPGGALNGSGNGAAVH